MTAIWTVAFVLCCIGWILLGTFYGTGAEGVRLAAIATLSLSLALGLALLVAR